MQKLIRSRTTFGHLLIIFFSSHFGTRKTIIDALKFLRMSSKKGLNWASKL